MKVTFNWLKEYVDLDMSPEDLGYLLTMLGLEVESIDHQPDPYEGVVVVQIEKKEQHPNADKLSVCQVNDGLGIRQIVCGATNFQVGDKVPLILPGNSLPPKNEGEKPFVIKVGKLRGVESQGMMCSGQELGLSSDSDGLMILDSDACPGKMLSSYLGRSSGDVIFDLETTPNRPDWNSVLGIAKEIAAKTGKELKIPQVSSSETNQTKSDELVDVRIENSELCPRYSARILKGVKVGDSPSWLVEKLDSIGIRSINNVVDVTNFVMMETGQPLHAFDLDLVKPKSDGKKPVIVVRAAHEDEKFITLDEQERSLDDQMAVIADETKAIALAGVMGGLNTEINASTKDVLLESAAFSEKATRRTSKNLGLKTDASYRFERGTDWNMVEYASLRAADLIQQTAGGAILSGAIDECPAPPQPRSVNLRFSKTDELLGTPIPAETQIQFLNKLGMETESIDEISGSGQFRIPSNRPDIKREVDLIEEVIRLYGIDNVTSSSPKGIVGQNKFDTIHDQLSEIRNTLVSMGLHEAQGQTLISGEKTKDFEDSQIALEYPLSSDMDVLRPSIIPGLIDSLSHNAHHNAASVGLFEIGKTFQKSGDEVIEKRNLGIVISGEAQSHFWENGSSQRLYDIYDMKGIFEEFMSREGLPAYQVVKIESPTETWVEAAEIRLGKNLLGIIGQLHPVVQKNRDIRFASFLCEIDLDLLLRIRKKNYKFKPIPQYPSTCRDVALLVDEKVTHFEVSQAVKKAKVKFLEDVTLFDIFRGKNVPDGQKSMAYSMTYRSGEKTLTDKEVQKSHDALINVIKTKIGAQVR